VRAEAFCEPVRIKAVCPVGQFVVVPVVELPTLTVRVAVAAVVPETVALARE